MTSDRELRFASFKLTHLVWLVFGIIIGLIALRVGLKLVAANPANPFAAFIYALTDLFLWPFFGLTVAPAVGGIVLEIPSIIAMLVYALAGWLVASLVWFVLYRPPSHVVEERTTINHHHDYE